MLRGNRQIREGGEKRRRGVEKKKRKKELAMERGHSHCQAGSYKWSFEISTLRYNYSVRLSLSLFLCSL